ncbi:MAG: phospholipid/cholesterol/gamma-HCH transport system permease protein [Rhodothermales bacterium]|jgi:phospholipid/cholesterol/gamma-HCH transport system permease protein
MSVLVRQLEELGRYGLFTARAAKAAASAWEFRKLTFQQAVRIGVNALPVVMLASAFAGIVTTVQTAYQLQNVILSSDAVGTVVVPTLMLEMCALVPGLVMASRVGASIAAELGTMRVTEQIDALEAMGIDSIGYLVVPRVFAAILMFPALYVAATVVAIVAGGMAGEFLDYLPFEAYIRGARTYFLPFDAFYGMTKSLAFGIVITTIACWKGFNTSGGADGVGKSATEAVVTSCVNILIVDYILAELLL